MFLPLTVAVMKPVDQPDFFSLRPPSYSQTLSGNRFTSIRDRPTRGRELDRDISPLHSPGLPRPPTTTPANTSSWSLLNTGFNILGGSYGSGSVGGGGGGGSASNPSGFNIGPGRVGRASSERRGSERRDSEVDLGSTLGTTKDASSLSRIDLRSPSLPGAATPPNSSDPIPVTRTQSLSEKERVKLQSSLAGQARPDGSVGGGGSLRSRVSFNAAAAAAGSSSSMMTGSGVGGLSGLGTAGTGSGAGSSLQKRMAAKDMALSLGGSQQQQQQQQQSQQTSRGKARLGIKATFVQPQLSKTYVIRFFSFSRLHNRLTSIVVFMIFQRALSPNLPSLPYISPRHRILRTRLLRPPLPLGPPSTSCQTPQPCRTSRSRTSSRPHAAVNTSALRKR
jgi:hypothetical protein